MNITPLDIQQKRFHVGFRGYERVEVDNFLDLVREEMEALLREVTELREFRQSYDQRMAELVSREETVKNTLIMTQKVSDDTKENARKEADLIIRDAEVRSQQIIGNTQQEKVRLETDIQELKRRKHHFLQDIKKVIQMHLEMVTFEESGNESQAGPAAE
ncbi:MAG TPA: DivIVA domain-containing protein [Nitrospirota bacterium]|nr:DivIVA domain-containing protein [Nitrospirota bacterium]